MQIYEALINDHRKLQGILDRLVALNEGDEDQRQEMITQVRDELIPHSRAEEAVFYNSIRAINTAQDLAWHGYEEHMLAESLLRTLQAADKIEYRVEGRRQETARRFEPPHEGRGRGDDSGRATALHQGRRPKSCAKRSKE